MFVEIRLVSDFCIFFGVVWCVATCNLNDQIKLRCHVICYRNSHQKSSKKHRSMWSFIAKYFSQNRWSKRFCLRRKNDVTDSLFELIRKEKVYFSLPMSPNRRYILLSRSFEFCMLSVMISLKLYSNFTA